MPKENTTQLAQAREELRQTRARLARADKMALLGSMVAGIAHEINTPVAAIVSMQDTVLRALDKLKEALRSEVPDFEQNHRLATSIRALEDAYRVIESGSKRVQVIVGRLRNFARLDEGERESVDLHEGLEDTLILLRNQLKNRITVEKEYGELPAIDGLAGQLKQVFLNLLVNAAQAIDDHGTIRVHTVREGNRAIVSIADDGQGIAPENLERVFEPGFTTKASGTGLGLAICREIISLHGGDISVESEVGKGTTFTIALPLTAA